ncbi:phenylphosphate carboxylase subunit delta [Candidatus Endobugula sertula]|uniref:3-deoxy-D-manno-octulosonate 8-phosphate phosphatase KdsC n=1 Tax=Candidatus Endobugula sertula TaxID=62101 RepID=A0A1D2QQR5_9GAMM|nr:phenylphosphate carboxylase subunit delta [Candidatus Endobugula sertula]
MTLDDVDKDIISRAKKIKWLVLDVDGVLTDGKLYFSNNGDEIKAFNSLDGHGIKMLQNSGVTVAIITGRTSKIVQNRTHNLGIKHLIQGREDKLNALEELISAHNVNYEEIAHMGDDYPDLTLIRRVGLGLTAANSHWIVKEYSHWQSQFNGGEGAVREACDLIMLAQNTFDQALASYL